MIHLGLVPSPERKRVTMKRYVAGLNEAGRSDIIGDGRVSRAFSFPGPQAPAGIVPEWIGDFDAIRPPLGATADLFTVVMESAGVRRIEPADGFDPDPVGLVKRDWPAGVIRWGVARIPAGVTGPFHSTPTVDFDTVLEGELDMILDETTVTLCAGDSVVMDGVSHAWHTTEGATIMFVSISDKPITADASTRP